LSTAPVDQSTFVEESELFGSEARLSWVLAGLAGLLGATAFTHSAGYFLTFMTGNSERAVLGFFRHESWLSITATSLLAAFVGGVVIASLCRRHIWVAHPHGPTVLTTFCLLTAVAVDALAGGWSADHVSFVPILFVAFGIGALNTSFVRDGEVPIPELRDGDVGEARPRHRTSPQRRGRRGVAGLLSAVRQLPGRSDDRRLHQSGPQRVRDAGGRRCRVCTDDRVHLLPRRSPCAAGSLG
jgi:hypothetical protein